MPARELKALAQVVARDSGDTHRAVIGLQHRPRHQPQRGFAAGLDRVPDEATEDREVHHLLPVVEVLPGQARAGEHLRGANAAAVQAVDDAADVDGMREWNGDFALDCHGRSGVEVGALPIYPASLGRRS